MSVQYKLSQKTLWPKLSKLMLNVLMNAEFDSILCFDMERTMFLKTVCVDSITGKVLEPALISTQT